MLIGQKSKFLLQLTQSKSKMFEFDVPLEEHVNVNKDAIKLLLIAIGSIDEISSTIITSSDYGILRIDNDLLQTLHFSASFFDSLISSRIDDSEDDDYFYLLGAVSYFFCDYLGSSKVMLSFLSPNISVGASGFEKAVWYVLNGDETVIANWEPQDQIEYRAKEIVVDYYKYFETGIFPDFKKNKNFFSEILFGGGVNRQILLCEILIALIKKKILGSALNLMPIYTGIPSEWWREDILRSGVLKELWPAQKILGENGFYNKKSGVIQMPTSSGKTTGIAIMFQSLFIKKRGQIGIVIAPFRALCKEISIELKEYFRGNQDVRVEEIFDIPEKDDINLLTGNDENIVFILTPEKLLFLLRLKQSILSEVSLIVFDEAHLFDSPHRGTKYELLIASVKQLKSKQAQVVLISAIIPNAEIINEWINDGNGVFISNTTLKAVEKSIAFSDWKDGKSRLSFINPDNPDIQLFYVPRVVDIVKLDRIKHDRKSHHFPDINIQNWSMGSKHKNDISIYYSLKLLHNGSVAIFCGQKSTVKNVINRILDLEKRHYDISIYKKTCKDNEHEKISYLLKKNFGEESIYTMGALRGILPHHADIPIGVKYSIEYAMSKKLVSTVVCTSTLAQGVNLPIKYLIVSNVYQAGERISVRDFHNLIGRTGRAGKYTEGSVILTEPFIYNHKALGKSKYKWNMYRTLIDANNSEPCDSTIKQLVNPIEMWFPSFNQSLSIDLFSIFIERYVDFNKYTDSISGIRELLNTTYHANMREFEEEVTRILDTLKEIENYILGFLIEEQVITPDDIAKKTLGYFLSSDEERARILHLFSTIFTYLYNIPLKERQKIGQVAIGVFQGRNLLSWSEKERESLLIIASSDEIIQKVLPKIISMIDLPVVRNIDNIYNLLEICKLWIEGKSYFEIVRQCNQTQVKILRRGKESAIEIEEIVQVCDKLFSYECLLPLAAVGASLSEYEEFEGEVLFNLFSKQLKYGVPNEQVVNIFELGFSDRHIAQLIAMEIPNHVRRKSQLRKYLRIKKDEFKATLHEYPSYFNYVLEKI